MGEFTKILKSFSIKETLNPKVWENPDDVEKSSLKPKVREALMKIAEKFIEYLGDDVPVEDITLTGSLSNFNWSEYSDFDLHILVDFEKYGKESELRQELFDARKYIFNESHDIKIYGYDVELYAQDTKEKHTSTGLYSIQDNKWLEKPKKDFPDINKQMLVQKIDSWKQKIERGLKSGRNLEDLKSKLKEYRKSGLEKEGELSYENLVFKFLRRSGHIGKLFDKINDKVDKELSVERKLDESKNNKIHTDSNIMKKNIRQKNRTNLNEEFNLLDSINNFIDSVPLLRKMRGFIENNIEFEHTPGVKTPYSKDVEEVQKGLKFLGFTLPEWGADGKFGKETEKAVRKFEESIGLKVDGVLDKEDLKYLTAALMKKGYSGTKIDLGDSSDDDIYEEILNRLGAPVSDENMKFMYAWRQAEGRGGTNNPFNTTQKMPGSTKFNSVGVQNFISKEQGLEATIKTLLNGRYGCIVDGLRNDIGANNIANCQSIHVWGTGDLVSKVLSNYDKGQSPKISPLS